MGDAHEDDKEEAFLSVFLPILHLADCENKDGYLYSGNRRGDEDSGTAIRPWLSRCRGSGSLGKLPCGFMVRKDGRGG